jgi:hypothetical protein
VEADTFSVPHSGPSENTSSALDDPRNGVQSEESDNQSPIQQSENLEDLDNLISAASCRRKIIKEKIGHELAILEIERQVSEQCSLILYIPYSLSPYRFLIPDTASSVTSFSRHIVISLASVVSYPS